MQTKRTCGKCPDCFHYGSDCECHLKPPSKKSKISKRLRDAAPALLEECQFMAREFSNEDGIFFRRHPHITRLLDVIDKATNT